ncbi:cytochrome P450 [Phellopilus nigrolimitatus]|nr:cytochrome P450 [Phellopilus nigrolimitatus]
MFDSAVTVSLVVLATTFFVKQVLLAPKAVKLPPSPPSDPIIGNARSMPLEFAYKTFGEWTKTYGDVIYASVLGRPMIIINSVASARDLMEKKGAIYSSRPKMWILGELMGWSNTLPFLQYGERFRKHRRMMQQHFNSHAVAAFRPIQSGQVNDFLRRVLAKPENFRKDVHRLIASSILMATFGHEVTSENDPYIALVNRTTKMSTDAGSPGGTIIDFFPALRFLPEWLPGMGLKRHARQTSELVAEVMEMPLREIQEKRAAGASPPCYVSYLLDEYESSGKVDKQHEEDIRCIGAVIYSAGVETTEATISAFFLMMTLYPDIVKCAQEEIDRVVGSDRLPTIEDRPNLPYIDCIMKEVYRFNPAVPIGIPHESMKTDTYRGWTIPSGSMIIPNIWNMMRDENYYPEPETFNPNRFVTKVNDNGSDSGDEAEGKSANIREDDPNTIVFGFGRRLCPGRHFADVTVWLTYACFLATFDIRPYVNPVTGKEELPEASFAGGTSSNPNPFKCSITPRSEKHVRLVQQDA